MDPGEADLAYRLHETWLAGLTAKEDAILRQEVTALMAHVNDAVAQYHAQHQALTYHHMIEAHLAMLGHLEACLVAVARRQSP